MFQLTFSNQSLSVMNSLTQGEQLNLMDELSSVSKKVIDGNDSELKRFNWKGKQFFRTRIDNLRVYFERVPPSCTVTSFFLNTP